MARWASREPACARVVPNADMNTSGVGSRLLSLSGQLVDCDSITGFVFEATEGISRLAIA